MAVISAHDQVPGNNNIIVTHGAVISRHPDANIGKYTGDNDCIDTPASEPGVQRGIEKSVEPGLFDEYVTSYGLNLGKELCPPASGE